MKYMRLSGNGKEGFVMCNEFREKILDIAAELIVSPLAAVAKVHEIKEDLNEYETYVKAKDTVMSAADDVRKAAKKAYENETVQKGVDAVRETAKKVSESEAFTKAREGLSKAEETVKEAASKIHPAKEAGGEDLCEDEDVPCEEAAAGETADEPAEEAKAPEDEKVFNGNIEDVIDEVDLSGIITEDDAKENIPEE